MSDTCKIVEVKEHVDEGKVHATVEVTLEKLNGKEDFVARQDILLPEDEKEQGKVLKDYTKRYREGMEIALADQKATADEKAEEEKAE